MSFPISTQSIERLTESFLERPPDEDLRYGNVVLLCQLLQSRIVEALPAQDRAVRLDDDAFLLAVFDDRLLLREWVKLNLINLENDGAECQRKVVRTASEVKSLTSGVSRPASLICFKCSTPCRYQSPFVSLGTSKSSSREDESSTHKVGDSDRLQNASVALLDEDFPRLEALLLSSRGVVQQEQVL